MGRIESFEELEIWKISLKIVKDIYKLVSCGPIKKDFGLRDQISRSAVSISSNIAEGFEKNNNNEFIRFLKISKGSIGELKSQLLVCKGIKYITESQLNEISDELENLKNQISRFINYLQTNKKQYLIINK